MNWLPSQRKQEFDARCYILQKSKGLYKRIIGKLQHLKPADSSAQEEIRELIAYLENLVHWMNYFKELKKVIPVGSVAIESANKFICHTRLKSSGLCGLGKTATLCWGLDEPFTIGALTKCSRITRGPNLSITQISSGQIRNAPQPKHQSTPSKNGGPQSSRFKSLKTSQIFGT